MRELWSDEVIARKHKEALSYLKTEGKPPTGFLSPSSTDCSDKSVEMLLHSASGLRNFFSIWGPCDVNLKRPQKNVFLQNCVTSEPGRLVRVMMSWFHRGSTSSSQVLFGAAPPWWHQSGTIQRRALLYPQINSAQVLATLPHYSSLPLFIVMVHSYSSSPLFVDTLHYYSSSLSVPKLQSELCGGSLKWLQIRGR